MTILLLDKQQVKLILLISAITVTGTDSKLDWKEKNWLKWLSKQMNHFEIYSTGSSLWTKEEILDETLDSNDVLKDKKNQAYTQWKFLDYI